MLVKQKTVKNRSGTFLSRVAEGGFTLIETAIVITILGLVVAPLFSFMGEQRLHEKKRAEEALNERVLASLSLFLKQNGRYPCPARTDVDPSNAAFGAELCGGAGITSTSGIYIGSLPVKALNLPMRASVNGDGWRFTYAVTQTLTDVATFDGTGVVAIQDENGAAFANNMHFAIVNPGRDGKGSVSLDAVASGIACAAAIDAENCDNNDAIFVEAPLSMLRSDPTGVNYNDDTISYTLARAESTFWMARQGAAGGASGLSITNRNLGNIGVGIPDPQDKVHVYGGDIRVQADGATGGNVRVDRDVVADQNIRAQANITATSGNVTANANVKANTGNIEAVQGNIEAAQGNIEAGQNVTAGNRVQAGNRVIAPAFYYQ